MGNANIFNREREKARLCLGCMYGNTARPEQKGLPYTCAKHFAKAVCPFWETYQAELRALDASATARAWAMQVGPAQA
jgi:hypothetical protein